VIVLAIMKRKIAIKKSAQDIQDEIFRKMSAEKKLKLASDFFKVAKILNPLAIRNFRIFKKGI